MVGRTTKINFQYSLNNLQVEQPSYSAIYACVLKGSSHQTCSEEQESCSLSHRINLLTVPTHETSTNIKSTGGSPHYPLLPVGTND